MNERVTKQMVEDGLWQDVIKISFEDMNEFIVTIGDNWFYSGGQDSDWRSASSIFDLVADGIFETLSSMSYVHGVMGYHDDFRLTFCIVEV